MMKKYLRKRLKGLSANSADDIYTIDTFENKSLDLRTAVNELKARGMLIKVEDEYDEDDYIVRFNCLLFQRYCKEGKMGTASASSEVPAEVVDERQLMPAGYPQAGGMSGGGNTVNNFIFPNAEKVFYNSQDNSQSNVQNNTMNISSINLQDASLDDLLSVLTTADGQTLNNILTQSYGNLLTFDRKALEAQGFDEEYIDVAEDTFYNSSFQFLELEFDEDGYPVNQVEYDENNQIIPGSTEGFITREMWNSLLEQFEKSGKNIAGDLSDELTSLVSKQSYLCQFYMKEAVIVQDSLQSSVIDNSAELVYYGKVLEQALKDNLYHLFHENDLLSGTMVRMPSGPDRPFCNVDVHDTVIGTYKSAINYNRQNLCRICEASGIQPYPGEPDKTWADWWQELTDDINTMRQDRNNTDHSRYLAGNKVVQQMYDYLVSIPAQTDDEGDETPVRPGLFERLNEVAQIREWYDEHPECHDFINTDAGGDEDQGTAPVPAAPPVNDESWFHNEFMGKVFDVIIEKRGNSGNRTATLPAGEYEGMPYPECKVKVSKDQVSKEKEAHEGEELLLDPGTTIQIKLGRWMDNQESHYFEGKFPDLPHQEE